MHMQGTPQTMQDNPSYNDVVEDIAAYLVARDEALQSGGIPAERICLDQVSVLARRMTTTGCWFKMHPGSCVWVDRSWSGILAKASSRSMSANNPIESRPALSASPWQPPPKACRFCACTMLKRRGQRSSVSCERLVLPCGICKLMDPCISTMTAFSARTYIGKKL